MVNIKDIQQFEENKIETSKNNIIKQIFDKQKELLEKYREIEKMPVNIEINNPHHQKLLKEFTFRGIEELAEAYEAFLEKDEEHLIEEISDAIHFFTEVLIMADISESELNIIDNFRGLSEKNKLSLWKKEFIIKEFWNITYNFSIACNRLKCKPWKRTQVLTDVNSYKKILIHSYNEFVKLLNYLGFSGEEILNIYINKHLVNKFRI
ncbi:MAG: dUTP diphosphatase, partial [Nanoarchaeota archaeon]